MWSDKESKFGEPATPSIGQRDCKLDNILNPQHVWYGTYRSTTYFDHLFGHKWHASLSHHHNATVLSTDPWENFTRLIRTILGPLERGEQWLSSQRIINPQKPLNKPQRTKIHPYAQLKTRPQCHLFVTQIDIGHYPCLLVEGRIFLC